MIMKQYLSPEQTAKLIELGFAPNARIKEVQVVHSEIIVEHDCHFAIGELIEMLPRCIESRGGDEAVLEISFDSQDFEWYCGHRWVYNSGWRRFNGNYKTCDDKELIDALYRYIVALTEEGVI
jgi:hypothetical protein